MKKLMLLAAMVALVLAVAVPAIAQVAVQEFGQETESGEAEVAFEAASTGSNGSQCVPANQFVSTGNLQNAQGFVQYASTSEDTEFEGSAFGFGPEMAVACDQTVQQSAAAG